LVEAGIPFSVSSLRADTLTGGLVRNLVAGGQKTLTIAPEAGSERLRRVLNKALTDEQVLHATEVAARAGMRRMKLYFMVGLPTEEPSDIEAICALVERVRAEAAFEQVSVSVSCFVPKPGTPFQWVGQEPLVSLERKVSRIRSRLRKPGIKVLGESPKAAVFEAVLARGDRRSSSLVRAAFTEGRPPRGAMGEAAVFYAERQRDRGELFPWDLIETGVARDYLWREWERALKGIPDPPCDTARCSRCGVCRQV
jgi:radical SAM superfamily enzyme YgiQ (UPF0313 family)